MLFSKSPTAENCSVLALLLKRYATSSISRTLLPIDSKKSEITLLSNTIWSETKWDPKSLDNSLDVSKSAFVWRLDTLSRSTLSVTMLSIGIGVAVVDESVELITWRSENFAYPLVWLSALTGSFQVS